MFSRAAVLRLAAGLVAGLLIGVVLQKQFGPAGGGQLQGQLAMPGMDTVCMALGQTCTSYLSEFESNDFQGMRKFCTGTVDECWTYVLQSSACSSYKSHYLANSSTCMVMPRGQKGSPPPGMQMGTAAFFDWAMMPSGWWMCDPARQQVLGVAPASATNYLLNNMCAFGPTQCTQVSGKWLVTANNPNPAQLASCPYVTNNTSYFGGGSCCALNGPVSCGNYNSNSCAQGECPSGQACQPSGQACGCAADCDATINEYNYVACCPEGGTECCDYATENALPVPAACDAPKNFVCSLGAKSGMCVAKQGNQVGTYATDKCDDECVAPCGEAPGEKCGGPSGEECCSADPKVGLECGDTIQNLCTTIDTYTCDVITGDCVLGSTPDGEPDKAQCDLACKQLCCSPNRTCDVIVPGVNMPNPN